MKRLRVCVLDELQDPHDQDDSADAEEETKEESMVEGETADESSEMPQDFQKADSA